MTIAGFAGAFWSFYPGLMTSDSVDQLEQARLFAFSDWHPPIMALLWHYMDRLSPGPVGLFALILALYWSGFWLLAARFARSRASLGYITILAAFAPMLAPIPAMIWKDSLVFSCFLSGSALLVASASRAGVWRALMIGPALILLLTGALARHNAMLAVGPLLMLGVRSRLPQVSDAQVSDAQVSDPQVVDAQVAGALGTGTLGTGTLGAGAGMLRLGALILTVAAVAWLAGWLLNRHVLDVRPSGVANSLLAFDIVGVAARTGVNGLPGAWSGDEQHRILHSCYEPWAWDSLAWGRCAFVKERLVAAGHWGRGLLDPWLAAITDHPGAYIRHRLAYTQALFGRMPALPPSPEPISVTYGFTANAGYRAVMQAISTISGLPIIADLWRAGLWGVLAMATCLVACMRARRHSMSRHPISRHSISRHSMSRHSLSRQAGYVSLSGLLYALPLVVVGVASEFRYVYWTIGAVFVAVLMLASDWLSEVASRRAGSPARQPGPLPGLAEPRRA